VEHGLIAPNRFDREVFDNEVSTPSMLPRILGVGRTFFNR